MNNEDLIDGLHVIARRRGQKIQQGDVEFVEAAIKALAKKEPRTEEQRKYVEIGMLHRRRTGEVDFHQEALSIPLALHGTLKVFMEKSSVESPPLPKRTIFNTPSPNIVEGHEPQHGESK